MVWLPLNNFFLLGPDESVVPEWVWVLSVGLKLGSLTAGLV